jgi:glyoxylase-like metal-dependent hydrolase (beta-lactamase superfamily II)
MIETIMAPNPGAFTLNGTCSYVVDGAICVDPGPAIESHIDAIIAAAPELRAIAVTHRHGDHAPGALLLARQLRVPIYAPHGVFEEGISEVITDGFVIDAGASLLTAVATPGHTQEHFCFLTTDRDLFTGDTVLGEGTTVIFPPDGHMGSYLASLRKLIALAPRAIYPGHGPIRTDAVELLEYYIAHRLEREEQIVAALGQSVSNVSMLRLAIYPELDSRLHQAAELQLQSHLVHLEELGRVEKSGDGYRAFGRR